MKDISEILNLKTVTTIKEKCPIHDCNLIRPSNAFIRAFGKSLPKSILTGFCPKCLEQLKSDEDQKMQLSIQYKKTKGFLKRSSLVKSKRQYTYTFDNFKTNVGGKNEQSELIKVLDNAEKIAKRYILNKNDDFNTLMYGNCGAGKTHLAMSILNAVNYFSKPPQKCLFVDLNVLLDKRLSNVNNSENNSWNSDYTKSIIKHADLIVVDDLGAESPNKQASAFTQKILNDIYDSNSRIITTTNLSLPQLKKTYEQRIISRILAGASNSLIDFSRIRDYRFNH